MNTRPDLFILAGEHSGDLHGSHLMRQMRERHPDWKMIGVGGPLMRAQGLEVILPTEELQVMGFTEIIASLPKLMRQFFRIRNTILERKPRVTVLIDYPGFNLRLAKSLRKKGYKGKIVQFICPTVWAWGRKRIDHMVKTLDLLLTIFPFEHRHFAHTPLSVKYVGHPLVHALRQHPYDDDWRSKAGLPVHSDIIGIFPGSRSSELRFNLPNQLVVVQELLQQHPHLHVGISSSHENYFPQLQQLIHKHASQHANKITIVPPKYTYDLMRGCHTAVATSGTVTLELACHHKPTLVMYHVTPINRFIAKYILRLKLPHYCIVNILGERTVFPELMETPFTIEAASQHLNVLYNDDTWRRRCSSLCKRIANNLYREDSMKHAVEAINGVIGS